MKTYPHSDMDWRYLDYILLALTNSSLIGGTIIRHIPLKALRTVNNLPIGSFSVTMDTLVQNKAVTQAEHAIDVYIVQNKIFHKPVA